MRKIDFMSLLTIHSARKQLVLFMAALLLMSYSYGQQKIKDSLQNEIHLLRSSEDFQTKDSSYINLLNNLGKELRFYKPDSLFSISKEAFANSKAAEFSKGEIESLMNIGDYYSDKGMHKKGVLNYLKAQSIAEELDNTSYILDTYNSLAGEYEYQGEYAKALKEYLKAMEVAESSKNDKMLSILNENIALLYASQKDYDQALRHFKTVKKINERIGEDLFAAHSLSNMASVYIDLNNVEYAMFNINASISIFEKYEVMDWLAYAYEVKGKVYLKQDKYKWALFWYRQSQALHDKNVDDERAEIDLLHGLAEAHLGIGNDSLSKYYAQKGFNTAQRLKIKEGVQKNAKTLYKIHKQKEDYLEALAYHELFQELSDTISRNESKKNLVMLKTKLNHEQQKEDLIANNEKALAKQKNYIYASMAILLVLLAITLLIRRNEKTQKALNKELSVKKDALEEREHELREINNTKDKLFSIIGHDLRGPIGAFKGLIQLFRSGEITEKEFLTFIPKLGSDIDHISFTLNNLLSWGQTQMKGTITQPSMVCVDNIVQENINLLSEIADKKSIKMVNELSENTLAWTDADQIDIVVRNLMSNALKFTPKNGIVTIAADQRGDHWIISVRDTGIGINKETQEKIFASNTNVTTYGTDNEKGTGLGLTLCKEMVENNKGTIWVESAVKKGTCFYFTVPKMSESYEQAS